MTDELQGLVLLATRIYNFQLLGIPQRGKV
jgi:hypothetical protein